MVTDVKCTDDRLMTVVTQNSGATVMFWACLTCPEIDPSVEVTVDLNTGYIRLLH